MALCFALSSCGGGPNASKSPPSSPGQDVPPPPSFPGGSPTGFFGINTNKQQDPWPATLIPVNSWRSLSGRVAWSDINTAAGVYDFSLLDTWLGMAKSGGQDVLYTVYATPSWASSTGSACIGAGNPAGCIGPPDTLCQYQGVIGACDPPNDLNCDGTGTDQHLIDFLTA